MIPIRKVLLATPIRLGLSSHYMAGLIPTIQKKIPGVQLEHVVLEGPSVNFARNEIAHYALKIGAREIIFIDDDMDWRWPHIERILSHVDLDVVANIYCKRQPGMPFWLLNEKPGSEIDPVTNLCEVNSIATGFMKIRVDTVLKTITEKFPELEYYNKPESGKPVTAWEFFPMGVVGPRSAVTRMKRIKAILAARHEGDSPSTDRERLLSIDEAISSEEEPGTLYGEDYYFCELARQCGFKIYADMGAEIMPHLGTIPFPILPEMVGITPTEALRRAGMNA